MADIPVTARVGDIIQLTDPDTGKIYTFDATVLIQELNNPINSDFGKERVWQQMLVDLKDVPQPTFEDRGRALTYRPDENGKWSFKWSAIASQDFVEIVDEKLDVLELQKVNKAAVFGSRVQDVQYRNGIIYESKGTVTKTESRIWLHDFRPTVADGAAFNTDGGNLFIGHGAGNVLTMTALPDTDVPAGVDANLQASHNLGIGIQAFGNLTIGYKNVGLGNNAGRYTTSGWGNTFIGRDAGHNNTTGRENTSIGFTAGQLMVSGHYNTSIGTSSNYNNLTGQGNTAIGRRAGFERTAGDYNINVGENSGMGHLTGSYNILIGKQAVASGITTGSNCLLIGSRFTGLPNVSNLIVIGDGSGNKVLQIDSVGTAPSFLDFSSKNTTAYNRIATDGQVGVGSSIFIRNLANIGNAVAQIVFQDRVGQPLQRIVSSGGAAGFLDFIVGNVPVMRMNASGILVERGNILASALDAKIGYTTGSGSTVTQLTSRSTPVTLDRPTGRIVLVAAVAAAGGVTTFTLNNTLISSLDVVEVSNRTGTVPYICSTKCLDGSCEISVFSPLVSPNEVVQLNFVLLKGAAS